MAGPYRVTLELTNGQFVAGDANTATLVLQDAQGRPVDGATVRVQPRIVTMVMDTPAVTGSAEGGGRYRISPTFAMAGEWWLDVTIARQGTAQQQVRLDANARWK